MQYYLEKTYYKTASLISNSCKAIALLAGQTTEVATLAFEYGKNLVGYLFFWHMLDVEENRIRKSTCQISEELFFMEINFLRSIILVTDNDILSHDVLIGCKYSRTKVIQKSHKNHLEVMKIKIRVHILFFEIHISMSFW